LAVLQNVAIKKSPNKRIQPTASLAPLRFAAQVKRSPLARLRQRAEGGGAYEQSGMAIDRHPAEPFIHHSKPIGFCAIWNLRFIFLRLFGP